MEAKYNVYDIANWFLSKESMTPKKLQKMIYYAYAWYLTIANDPEGQVCSKLFDSRIEAWVHGPVIPEIYAKYKPYGYNEIDKFDEHETFDYNTENILDQVFKVYNDFDGNELESITHQELPWINARNGAEPLESSHNEIRDKDIIKCYSSRIAD
ncbi:Panacea domain-containing protein [Tetragenococcus muriaticus]|uniref:Putative phage protein n=1 Tax=Tetragenococcus muriaticus 3MR10-3 TaxID=1302648 RepID=A0A091C677_9ENTE|nr:type II toxin-antitoxin system antitoxin SocA domain-containing protein [Tetragenococcus muriaticus]KFN92190.1 putative phage protein [Tetragenococcus muriaticus 3MR10-3]